MLAHAYACRQLIHQSTELEPKIELTSKVNAGGSIMLVHEKFSGIICVRHKPTSSSAGTDMDVSGCSMVRCPQS
jgi:hypothetical protein